ncbi:hypothetical protein GOBAR_AA19922 [Gossypium barbadense]|uniref:Uncharacterized protein n=1 Tax=Gossypium barbadense TaxID=3634 RepID=A0A2P5XBP1_GOSBA|nr:hypothetical protein GOBAR_AA19922 [Gossypium barbadense]
MESFSLQVLLSKETPSCGWLRHSLEGCCAGAFREASEGGMLVGSKRKEYEGKLYRPSWKCCGGGYDGGEDDEGDEREDEGGRKEDGREGDEGTSREDMWSTEILSFAALDPSPFQPQY